MNLPNFRFNPSIPHGYYVYKAIMQEENVEINELQDFEVNAIKHYLICLVLSYECADLCEEFYIKYQNQYSEALFDHRKYAADLISFLKQVLNNIKKDPAFQEVYFCQAKDAVLRFEENVSITSIFRVYPDHDGRSGLRYDFSDSQIRAIYSSTPMWFRLLID